MPGIAHRRAIAARVYSPERFLRSEQRRSLACVLWWIVSLRSPMVA